MRVSSNNMVGRYVMQLNDSYENQSKLMEQSDGSNLHRPSDDSVRYSKYLRYSNSNSENLQYQNNVDSGRSWMKTADAAMINMTDIYTTLKEKTLDAATDTNGAQDMVAISKEFKAKLYEIVSLQNSQQGDRYLFAGQSDLTQPFVISVDMKKRGLAKTLDDPQAKFFTNPDSTALNVDSSGSLTQMLTMEDSATGDLYYLNTMNGNIYTEDFIMNGYKNKVAGGQTYVAVGDEVDTLAGWGSTVKVSDYFENTGEIKAAGTSYSPSITVDGKTVNLKLKVVEQPLVSYQGDAKYISMVKLNGKVEQTSDTVNATGQDLNGSDIFDDANSGNQETIMSNGKICYVSSGTAMLNNMFTVCVKMEGADPRWMSSDGVTIADMAHNTITTAQSSTAARQNVYDSVATMLDKQNEVITADINDVSGTDVAELAVRLMEAQTIYNMSLSVGSRILPPSLADYLK